MASASSASASTHGTPTSAPASTIAWLPRGRLCDLAVTIKNVLLASPTVFSKTGSITEELIIGMLKQRLSFNGLCAMLEARGLIRDGGVFARSLLATNPKMATTVKSSVFRTSHSCYFLGFSNFNGPLTEWDRYKRDRKSLNCLRVQLHDKHAVSSEDLDTGDDETKIWKRVWQLEMTNISLKTEG
ncbi:MAG: hypothetical protein Q9213_004375 [Squamulea squamosa]